MKLSAPIYVLKSQAKALKRRQNISLTEALDQIAKQEGFATWSLLAAKSKSLLPSSYSEMLDFLNPGDLVLVAARPGMGKGIFAIGLIAQAFSGDRPKPHLFTLVEREEDTLSRLAAYGDPSTDNPDLCWIDCSNDICADYIIAMAKDRVRPGTLIVVDYLQMLDEKRVNPPLQTQIESLQNFAKTTGAILLFVCQIDRAVADRANQRPTISDIRLPNPLDLALFNKIIFLYRDSRESTEAEVSFAGAEDHLFKIGLDLEQPRFFDLA